RIRGDRRGARPAGRNGAITHQSRPRHAAAQAPTATPKAGRSMNRCDQARRLFGAYWDDEVTQAEREWLESHLAGCPGCRQQYEQLARTLETVGSLPRTDVAADLPERALQAARRATAAPDRIAVAPARPAWIPVTAAAALFLLGVSSLLPWLGTPAGQRLLARPDPRETRGAEARYGAAAVPSGASRTGEPRPA